MEALRDLLVPVFGDDIVKDYLVQVIAGVSVSVVLIVIESLRCALGSFRRRATPLEETTPSSHSPKHVDTTAAALGTGPRRAPARASDGSRGSTPVFPQQSGGLTVRSITFTGAGRGDAPPTHSSRTPPSPTLLRTAAMKGFYDVDCEMCRGEGSLTVPDANSPGGRSPLDPCPLCFGTGRAWVSGPDSGSSGSRPRFTDAQVLALDSSAAHEITSTDAQVEEELREIMTRHVREGVTPWRPHQQERFRIQRRRELRSK